MKSCRVCSPSEFTSVGWDGHQVLPLGVLQVPQIWPVWTWFLPLNCFLSAFTVDIHEGAEYQSLRYPLLTPDPVNITLRFMWQREGGCAGLVKLIFFFLKFFEMGVSLCSPGWPGTHKRSTCLHLLSVEIKSVSHMLNKIENPWNQEITFDYWVGTIVVTGSLCWKRNWETPSKRAEDYVWKMEERSVCQGGETENTEDGFFSGECSAAVINQLWTCNLQNCKIINLW